MKTTGTMATYIQDIEVETTWIWLLFPTIDMNTT